MTPSLLELEKELQALQNELDAAMEEEDPDKGEPAANAITIITDALVAAKDKRDSVGHMLAQMHARAQYCKDRAAHAKAQADRIDKARERLERWVAIVMASTGAQKIEGHEYTFTLRENPGHVRIIYSPTHASQGDAKDYRPEHVRVIPEKVEPDKIAIRKSLKEGEELPYAVLEPGDVRLYVPGVKAKELKP